jgi:hypothetical protein
MYSPAPAWPNVYPTTLISCLERLPKPSPLSLIDILYYAKWRILALRLAYRCLRLYCLS